MKSLPVKKIITSGCLFILMILLSVHISYAKGGKVTVYYGTDTSGFNNGSPSANGVGGGSPAVTIAGYTVPNTYTFYEYSGATISIVIKPDSTHKISSAQLIEYNAVGDQVGDPIDITISDPLVQATYSINMPNGNTQYKRYFLLVKYDTIDYKLNYTIDADLTSPLTNCESTANITPAALVPAYLTITPGATQTFTISNTNALCSVDAIDFDNTGYSTVGWNAGTNQYTTPAITGNKTFKIRYKGPTYQVTTGVDGSGAAGCGSISPATQVYGVGSTQIFSVIVNSGCAVQSFTDNGSAVTLSPTNTYTLSNISADHTLTVKFSTVATSSGANYCQVPPFMDGQNVLKPNVLIIFDTSGSMASGAYYTSYTSSYSQSRDYYGYFQNDTMYTVSGSKYLINSSATLDRSAGKLSGNYLNYRYMRRVDILRKILVGGKVDASAGSARNSATGGTNVRYLATDDGKLIEYGTTDPVGLLHQTDANVRMALMIFNRNSYDISSSLNNDGGKLIAEMGSSLDKLVDQVENSTDPNGNTPLAESMYEAIRYFQGGVSAYNTYDGTNDSAKLIKYNGTATDSNDPHRVYAKPVQGSCQNNYIVLVTDGDPTKDKNIPGQSSATVVDSAYTDWWAIINARTPKPTTELLGRVAYYAHTFDLKNNTATTTKAVDPSTLQSITLYSVYSFGASSGVATLQEASRFGAFLEDRTIPATNKNGRPDVDAEYLTDTTNTSSYRGYYEADDGTLLQAQLTNIFNSIVNSTASGTAAAVANNKSGQRGANMIQALFYPQFPTDSTKKWMGEVQALWYYLDPLVNFSAIYQDSTPDKELNLLNDDYLPSDPFETKALWRAGAKLQTTAAGDRHIYTPIGISTTYDLTDSSNAFVSTAKDVLKSASYMNIASLTDPGGMIDYLRGVSNTIYRNRTVTFTDPTTNTPVTGVWKLGDIVNSTPIVQSSVPINAYSIYYSDNTYLAYTKLSAYKARNIVYTGSNDGMLHAFRLGSSTSINDKANPFRIAKIAGQETDNSDLGKEEWAFIPKNALPYLQHQCGSDYCHQYLLDGAPLVVDASANMPAGCTEAAYWNCTEKTDSWKSVLIGSMGLGGASRDKLSNCNETYPKDNDLTNNTDCVKTPVADNGLSSYFALDVTDPLTPKYMWEFSDYDIAADADKGLGFTTAGAAFVRIGTGKDSGGSRKNGRWFVVLASGPTGAIDSTHRYFAGRSDQNLKLYIVDINASAPFKKCTSAYTTTSDCNYWVKDTGIPFAFANSLNGSVIDLDRLDASKPGFYSDDVVYVSYTKATLSSGYPASATAWNKGGVMRLVTNNDPDPYNWFTSPLIDNVGPITTAVEKIQDVSAKKLWVFFGEGRYFFPGDERTLGTARKFYGVQDPCYDQYSSNIDQAMKTTAAACRAINTDILTGTDYIYDQSGETPAANLPSTVVDIAGTKTVLGWSVNMATTSGSAGDERVVSDVSATYTGLIFYTTYTPNTDICTPGGVSSLWAVKYNTGGTPSASSMMGKAPLQTSSGGITLIDLATSFTQQGGRKLSASLAPSGMAPKGKFPPLLSPKPSKQILQIREN